MAKTLQKTGTRLPKQREPNQLFSSFKERIAPTSFGTDSCLLLDISGSMGAYCEDSERRIDKLRKIVENFQGTRTFAFDSSVEEITDMDVPEPRGGTFLHTAIQHVTDEGLRHAVLITDGEPNYEQEAIDTAIRTGIKLDIIFVGDGGTNRFLERLAEAVGGSYQDNDISNIQAITTSVRALLGAGDGSGKKEVFHL